MSASPAPPFGPACSLDAFALFLVPLLAVLPLLALRAPAAPGPFCVVDIGTAPTEHSLPDLELLVVPHNVFFAHPRPAPTTDPASRFIRSLELPHATSPCAAANGV